LGRIEEFLQKMSAHSVYYKQNAVPGHTAATVVEKTIKAHLCAGLHLQQMASALDLAINSYVQPFISISFRPPMLETMESYFISYCPDQASEKKTLNEWFDGHSKNNIAPMHLLW
jgi:hypothetical protein